MSMKLRYPFLYLVLASGLIAAALLVFNANREDPIISSSVLTRDRVAIIDIVGVITSSHDISQGTSSSRHIIEQLQKYGENDSVKAIVLRIDSPGGTVVAAQEVYGAVNRLRHETGKTVVVSMADVAASGGYYISCAADIIFANPGTITGSIGVIMEFPNLEGLFGKIGIRTTTIKSGEFKDTGNALRAMTERETRLLQDLIDDVFAQFVDAVEKGREMDEGEVRTLADGRIFTGRQAKELGLIDELGDLKEAIDRAAELAGIEGEPVILQEKKKRRFWDLLESRLAIILPRPTGGLVSGGRLFYLWK